MRSLCVTLAVAAVVLLVSSRVECIAQISATSNEPQEGPAFVKLFPPVYPTLARQADITGDAEILLIISQDGVIESAMAGKGHPLLKQSALDCAQQSQYECRNCREPVIS